MMKVGHGEHVTNQVWMETGRDKLHCRRDVFSYSWRSWNGCAIPLTLFQASCITGIENLLISYYLSAKGGDVLSIYPVTLHSVTPSFEKKILETPSTCPKAFKYLLH